jgi:site-specific DNA-methyltransferase (adenine-specific)
LELGFEYDNSIKVYDCLKGLKMIEDSSADIIIVDPPYNIKKNFGNNNDNMPMDQYLN